MPQFWFNQAISGFSSNIYHNLYNLWKQSKYGVTDRRWMYEKKLSEHKIKIIMANEVKKKVRHSGNIQSLWYVSLCWKNNTWDSVLHCKFYTECMLGFIGWTWGGEVFFSQTLVLWYGLRRRKWHFWTILDCSVYESFRTDKKSGCLWHHCVGQFVHLSLREMFSE